MTNEKRQQVKLSHSAVLQGTCDACLEEFDLVGFIDSDNRAAVNILKAWWRDEKEIIQFECPLCGHPMEADTEDVEW